MIQPTQAELAHYLRIARMPEPPEGWKPAQPGSAFRDAMASARVAVTASRCKAEGQRWQDEQGRVFSVDEDNTWTPDEGFAEVEELAQFQRLKKVSREYLENAALGTGAQADPEKHKAKRKEREKLLAQTHTIARKIEEAGGTAYRAEKWCLWRVGVHSMEVDALPGFRRSVILPAVAQQLRAPMLREVEYFLSLTPFTRFWTFTSGENCILDNLRARISELHRRISQLNAAPFMREAGAEIVFRSTELGSLEEKIGDVKSGELKRDEEGRLLFHPHAHCLVWLKNGPLENAKWKQLLKDVWNFWEHNWDDGKIIANVRECCKYVTKPGEICALDGKDIVALQAALYRMKLVQPLGALAEQIKARKAAEMTLIRKMTTDGPILAEVGDWNNRGKTTQAQKDMDAAMKLKNKDVDACKVVSAVLPQMNSQGIAEPFVMVMGTRYDAQAVANDPLVKLIRSYTADEYAAGCALAKAASIRVHTCTSTVISAPPLPLLAQIPPRVRPPTPPIWAVEASPEPEKQPEKHREELADLPL